MIGFKKILILGGSGFIGTHLKSYFAANYPKLEIEDISLPSTDLAEKDCLSDFHLRYDSHTALVLLAATKRQQGDSLESFHRNLRIIENVGKVLLDHSPGWLVFISSAAVYGEEIENLAIQEATPVHPQTFYGLSKFSGERLLGFILGEWARRHLLCVRPPLIYGPGEQRQVYGPAGFCALAAAKNAIRLWGNGNEKREFLFVEDFCRILCFLLKAKSTGVINAAFGISHSFLEVVQTIDKILGQESRLEFAERTRRQVDHRFDPSNLMRQVGQSIVPTPLEVGLRQTLGKSC